MRSSQLGRLILQRGSTVKHSSKITLRGWQAIRAEGLPVQRTMGLIAQVEANLCSELAARVTRGLVAVEFRLSVRSALFSHRHTLPKFELDDLDLGEQHARRTSVSRSLNCAHTLTGLPIGSSTWILCIRTDLDEGGIELSVSLDRVISLTECTFAPRPREKRKTMLSVGVRYLFRLLPVLLLPPLSTAYILSVIGLRLHATIYVLLSLLSLPCGLVVMVQWNGYSDRRQARELNAVLPPRIVDKSIGGLRTLRSMVENVQRGYFADNLAEWSRTLGPVFNIRIMFENRMFTTEPEHIKSILSTNFNSFEKGSHFRFQFSSLLGTGIFNVDDDLWKFHRGISRPFFTKERISDLQGYIQHSDMAVVRVKSGCPIDFQDLVSRYTLDWATDVLFGANVGSLGGTLPSPSSPGMPMSDSNLTPADAFMRSFQAAEMQASMRTRFGPLWPLLELRRDEVKHHMAPVYKFVTPIIRTAVERNRTRNEAKQADVEELTFLDYLVQHTQDMTMLRDATVNMLVAGRDTNTFLLSAAIYGLAEHPSVLSRLRAEILDAFGTSGTPTFHDLRTLKYLRAVLNETMRMWAPVPINIRKSKKAALWAPVVPGGKPFCVPAKTKVSFSVFLMHRRKDLWGPDADQYDPDRFLDERYHKYLAPNPYIFLPFNGGPRTCLGSEVAYNQATFFLIRLLQKFSDIELAPEAQPAEFVPKWSGREKVWFTSHISMYYKGGLWVKMKRADSDE
ncbi:Cytochrome P450 monooxygenase pc-3 [Mycena venus]|uniref:Cytochrome P450 monooxygenase pc-3 n=1 Tax=Mycena venus TaxID=2733690 RepID=A0A8H6XGX2_9AGAR|nr:Cytochrome P450 monooxygenase pc-3 [Mycena venus]